MKLIIDNVILVLMSCDILFIFIKDYLENGNIRVILQILYELSEKVNLRKLVYLLNFVILMSIVVIVIIIL